MMPPTVARIGGWLGLVGDRAKGIRYLTECYSAKSPPYYASFAAVVQCNFLVGLITYMQEREEIYLPDMKHALNWGKMHHPQSVLFLLIEARLRRHERRVEDATRLAEQCIIQFREGGLPEVAVLLNIFTGWCEMFACDWSAAAKSTNRMLHSPDYPLGYYDTNVDYTTNRTPWSNAYIASLDTKSSRLLPSRINSQAFYSLITAFSHFHLSFLAAKQEKAAAAATGNENDEGKQTIRSESKLENQSASSSSSSASLPLVQSPSPSSSPAASSSSSSVSASPSPLSSSSSSSVRCTSQEELNTAFFYVQNALTLLDSRRYKPMDIYTKRKSLELLQRSLTNDFEAFVWLDTCELFLKWNGAQQMNQQQIEYVLNVLRDIQQHLPSSFNDVQRAVLHLYQGTMLRGLSALLPRSINGGNEYHQLAYEQLKRCLAYEQALLHSSQVKIEGTLSFVYYETAIICFEMNRIGEAKEYMKKSSAIKDFDQSNVMQVRNHALAKMIKEYKTQHTAH